MRLEAEKAAAPKVTPPVLTCIAKSSFDLPSQGQVDSIWIKVMPRFRVQTTYWPRRSDYLRCSSSGTWLARFSVAWPLAVFPPIIRRGRDPSHQLRFDYRCRGNIDYRGHSQLIVARLEQDSPFMWKPQSCGSLSQLLWTTLCIGWCGRASSHHCVH
jgi:hypothetical protein